MIIRKASADSEKDIDILIQFRVDYFSHDLNLNHLSKEEEAAMRAQMPDYFRRHLGVDMTAFIAEIDGKPVGTAFLLVVEKPANPVFLNGKTGMMLNVYTSAEYRLRGIATKVMEAVLEEARRQELVYIELLATPAGRKVYEKMGFFENIPENGKTNMKIYISDQSGK